MEAPSLARTECEEIWSKIKTLQQLWDWNRKYQDLPNLTKMTQSTTEAAKEDPAARADSGSSDAGSDSEHYYQPGLLEVHSPDEIPSPTHS